MWPLLVDIGPGAEPELGMSQCVAFNANGVLVAATEPCTALVILTPGELAAINVNPFVLTQEDGILLSGAICVVWGTAWAARAIRSVLSDGDSKEFE